jgi:ribosome-associated protein
MVEATTAEPISKTRRKAQMHALQDLGEALVALEPRQLTALLDEVELPERLREAIVEARAITAWGGRKRQLQYVGKLMREIDPEPIARWLDALAQGRRISAARQHALERWRDRLLADNEALDALAAAHPELDRPRLRALIHRARDERAAASPPHAYRELFRALNETIPGDAAPATPTEGT